MSTSDSKTLVDLEARFWQSMVDQDTDAALEMLNEPALMVSEHGAMQFDHDGYRKMADQGTMVVKAFELSDVEVVFPNDSIAILTYGVTQQVADRQGGKATTAAHERQLDVGAPARRLALRDAHRDAEREYGALSAAPAPASGLGTPVAN